jgi:hypothetical protein
MKRFLIITLCIILPIVLPAQNFSYKAKLDPVSNTSFYKIKINADVVGYCNNQLEDLRLFDNDGKEIPYLLNKEPLYEQNTAFQTYPFSITKKDNKDIVVIENKNKDSVNQFLFEMKNADASRLVRISGSDNKTDWFVVRDSFYFGADDNGNTPMVQRFLRFPETDYAFYKVEISNDNNESPLNIIRIGKNSASAIAAVFQAVNGLNYKIVDSNKSTFIHFKLKSANKIDKLSFTIDAPEMYHRSVVITKFVSTVYNDDSHHSNSIKSSRAYDPATISAELSSSGSTNINCTSLLGEEKCDSFIVQILNQDDAPLHIKSIDAFQLGVTITAKLEKEKSYFLYFGDSLLTTPVYDLVYFEKNIPSKIESLGVQAVQPKEQKDKDEYNGNKDKWIVWIGLGLAGIIILLLTVNMMKKMNHADE